MTEKQLTEPDKHNSFLGVRMAQSDRALWLWDRVLSKSNPERILELGTFYGGLSLYFHYWCERWDKEFHTWENVYTGQPKEVVEHIHRSDMWKDVGEIKKLIQQKGRTLLFCDGGDKAREAETFVPYLKQGDILGVHDWGKEIFMESIPENFAPILESECDEERILRFFHADRKAK